MATPDAQIAGIALDRPVDLSSRKVQEKLSSSALLAFFRLTDLWNLRDQDARGKVNGEETTEERFLAAAKTDTLLAESLKHKPPMTEKPRSRDSPHKDAPSGGGGGSSDEKGKKKSAAK